MRIIFIRHGDPDYVNDALTDKGVREAKLLADRIAGWDTSNYEFYCSPKGRARQTASYTLERLGREAPVYDWMKEFAYLITDPTTGRVGVPWDFMPEYWTEIPEMFHPDDWKKTDIYRSNPELLPAYDAVCSGLDGLLAEHGYIRHNRCYRNTKANPSGNTEADPPNKHDTIVIFCHLGITCVMMSHLLHVSPALLFHSLYLAPTSVTILATEERLHDNAFFRAQVIGDTSHLSAGGEPVSAAGYFTDVFNG